MINTFYYVVSPLFYTQFLNQIIFILELFEFQGAFNVIVVDWENEARHSYSTAVSYVPFVANELSGFIRWLVEQGSADSGGIRESIEREGSSSSEESDEPEIKTTRFPPIGPENDLKGFGTKSAISPGVDVSKLHLVGFNLGAHIAGIASRQLRLSLGVVGRITGK